MDRHQIQKSKTLQAMESELELVLALVVAREEARLVAQHPHTTVCLVKVEFSEYL